MRSEDYKVFLWSQRAPIYLFGIKATQVFTIFVFGRNTEPLLRNVYWGVNLAKRAHYYDNLQKGP